MARPSAIASWLQDVRLHWHWSRIGAKLNKGMTPLEVEAKVGPASKTWSEGGLRFWLYDCFNSGGYSYGIAIVFDHGRVQQVYWRMEPSADNPLNS